MGNVRLRDGIGSEQPETNEVEPDSDPAIESEDLQASCMNVCGLDRRIRGKKGNPHE